MKDLLTTEKKIHQSSLIRIVHYENNSSVNGSLPSSLPAPEMLAKHSVFASTT